VNAREYLDVLSRATHFGFIQTTALNRLENLPKKPFVSFDNHNMTAAEAVAQAFERPHRIFDPQKSVK
jgi:folylpolyglutamate synthase/dihydropteroate synthase